MKKFRDIHKGQTALIMGNGPSLDTVPRTLLERFISFGANSITLAYTHSDECPKNLKGFVANYLVAINPLVIEQNKVDILNYPALAFFLRAGSGLSGDRIYPLISTPPQFSYTPEQGIYEGFTVTYVSLQLAFFMGFSTVYLVGVDHNYSYQGEPNEENDKVEPDLNHFHPDYFKGQKWNNPDLVNSTKAYAMAENAYRKAGREIINLPPNTALDVFEKGEYADVY